MNPNYAAAKKRADSPLRGARRSCRFTVRIGGWVAESGNSWTIFLSACLSLWVAPLHAFAHDPGLSTGQLRILPDRIETELTFARADIETLVQLDADGDGRVSALELATAKPALEQFAHEALFFRMDERFVAVGKAAYRLDDTNNFHLIGTWPLRKGRALIIRSALIDRLPRGHRQFVTVLAPTGTVLTEALLSAEQNVINLEVKELCEAEAPPFCNRAFRGFLTLGVEHIATGYDHLLFLFALLMMAPGFRQAALIITSFTVAHSITLGLATLNVVNIPSKYVEPLIAASIVYVGVENLRRRDSPRGRWLLTFAFGLVHGFGFASVLRDLGVSSGTTGIALPLVSFNLGVEAGQIAIAAIALPLIWFARKSPAGVRFGVPICSSVVIALGGWWLLERTVL
jgi:hydrogenase/urease accessory protein HupE